MSIGRFLFEHPHEISAAMVGHRWQDLVELVEFVQSDEEKDAAKLELYNKLGWHRFNLEELRKLSGKR